MPLWPSRTGKAGEQKIGLKDFVKTYPDSDASRYLTGNYQSQNKDKRSKKKRGNHE